MADSDYTDNKNQHIIVSMDYGYRVSTEYGFEEAVARIKESLSKEGFGVLSEIKVHSVLKEKLNVDHDEYTILGACNPPFAELALRQEKEIGLLLPCNVIVYRDGEKSVISAIRPTLMTESIKNPELAKLTEEVEEKLKRAIDAA